MSDHAVLNANYLRKRIIDVAEAQGVSDFFCDGVPLKVVKHEISMAPL